jgi:hypothetical protein
MTKRLNDLVCLSTVYITPPLILDPTREYFGGRIPLDPATELNNPTDAEVYAVAPRNGVGALELLGMAADETPLCLLDGLAVPWSDYDGVFVNPPYGKEIRLFCEKIYQETLLGATILALLPAGPRFSTGYFQEFIFNPGLCVACFLRGRVAFLRPDGTKAKQNPYDSVIYGFNIDEERFVEVFANRTRPDGKEFGKVILMEVA